MSITVDGVAVEHRRDSGYETFVVGKEAVMRITLSSPFNCCGAKAVSCPWVAADRLLASLKITKRSLINAAIERIMYVHDVSALVQVDRIGDYEEDEDEFHINHSGVWQAIVNLWEGKFLEVPIPFQNVSEGDTALSLFAFINPDAAIFDGEHQYKNS